jgi:transcriptional regulator with XRE-family HTH domain
VFAPANTKYVLSQNPHEMCLPPQTLNTSYLKASRNVFAPANTKYVMSHLISTELHALLRHASLSQAAFARLCRVGRSAVSLWCSGKRPIPYWVSLLALAAQKLDLSKLVLPTFAWHDILGVPPESDLTAVKCAYLSLASIYHPDHGGSTVMMQRINDAYGEARTELERNRNWNAL